MSEPLPQMPPKLRKILTWAASNACAASTMLAGGDCADANPCAPCAAAAIMHGLGLLTGAQLLDGFASCLICGCTEDNACPGGCAWVEQGPNGFLCSACDPTEPPSLIVVPR